MLTQRGLPALPQAALGNNGPVADARVTLGSGWSAFGLGLGGGFGANTSSSGTLSFTPAESFDTIVVYAQNNPGQGTGTINVDGGSSLGNISTNTTAGVGVFTFTCTAGTHTINLPPPTGGFNFRILGIDTYLSTAPPVSVYNGGKSGCLASYFTDTSTVWTPYNHIPSIAPDLTIVNLVINDSNQTGQGATNTATYTSQMTTIIQRAQTYGDCLLVVGNPTSGEASLQTYRDINYSLADTLGCALIDLKDRWTSYAVSNPLGYYADSIHPGVVGYNDIAAAICNVLVSTVSGGGSSEPDLEGLNDVDLTSPANDDFIQRKSGQFVDRTVKQVKDDLVRVTSVSYGATVTPNADTTDVLNVGALTGDITIAAPTGTPKDGQTLTIRFVQDGTGSRVVTWNAAFAFGTDITAADEPTAASAKWQRIFEWNATDSKWRATRIVRGF
jgi:hypothetical protein